MTIHGAKARQTVTPDGKTVQPAIAGVKVHQQPTNARWPASSRPCSPSPRRPRIRRPAGR